MQGKLEEKRKGGPAIDLVIVLMDVQVGDLKEQVEDRLSLGEGREQGAWRNKDGIFSSFINYLQRDAPL